MSREHPRLRWAAGSVGIWILIGLVLGAIFGNIMVTTLESVSTSPEAMGYEIARILVPIAGVLWGLAAGSIGAGVAVASRSAGAYTWFMTVSAVAPFAFYAYFPLVEHEYFVPMGLSVVVGVVIWLIARRFNPPLSRSG